MSDIEQAVEIINRVAWVSTDETIGNPSEVVYALRDARLLRDSKASAAIERVRALHHPTDWPTHAHATCPTCVTWNHEAAMGDEAATPEQWPCPTIRALDAGLLTNNLSNQQMDGNI